MPPEPVEVESPEQALETDKRSAIGSYSDVLTTLQAAIKWLRWATVLIFVVGSGFIAWALVELPRLTSNGVEAIIQNPDNTMVAVYELLRGTAFAAVVASLVFGVLSLGRAALDQATRYQKRLMAANFMHYVLVKYEDQIVSGQIQLSDVVNFIDAWSKNVESAFTNVKFGSAKSQKLEIGFDPKGGVIFKQGDTSPAAKAAEIKYR
jgi:hypothetical protein